MMQSIAVIAGLDPAIHLLVKIRLGASADDGHPYFIAFRITLSI